MKICPSCQKTSSVAGGYSNRVRATKFNPTTKSRKQPNLQWAMLPSGSADRRIKMCTKCIKAGKNLTHHS